MLFIVVQLSRHSRESGNLVWIPAFAGMTALFLDCHGGYTPPRNDDSYIFAVRFSQ